MAPPKIRIVVVQSGGIIQEVYADQPWMVDLVLIDFDEVDEEDGMPVQKPIPSPIHMMEEDVTTLLEGE